MPRKISAKYGIDPLQKVRPFSFEDAQVTGQLRKLTSAPPRILVLAGAMLNSEPPREHMKARVHHTRCRCRCLRSTTIARGAEAGPTNVTDLMTFSRSGATLSNSVRT
jgi:hypothetical protein